LRLRALVHPLLAQAQPLTLELDDQGLLITGHNGVGKSTLLRAVGLSLLAARAFGYCYARAATVSDRPPMSSIENHDNLQTADSLYMAELRRAAAMLSTARSGGGAVFLIDELFRGTNHVESVSAAAAVLAALARHSLVLASTLTKRLDAAWAVGSGNGGRDTGSIADGTWHVWLIKRSDTGVVDALFSTSATSPTMPSNYDIKRRIGSVIRTSGTLNGLTQIEDHFYYGATDRNDTSAVSNTLLTLTVPTGIKVRPILNFSVAATGSANITVTVNNGDLATSNQTILQVRDGGTQVKQFRNNTSSIWTNTSGQIRFTQSNNTGTPDTSSVYTAGWIDPRM